jgi:drug/metabolite transporter (DMT)-like permease
MVVVATTTLPAPWRGVGATAWLGFAYVAVFSMLVAFVLWYRGLALGGIARVGQLQLLQPFLGLLLSALLLREANSWTRVTTTGLVVLCVFGAKQSA